MPDARIPLAPHHVTAVCADAQANVDFYAKTLGLKLVKQTVNYDDPSMLHLYYGDATGAPGSLVTFFVVPGAERGGVGWPQLTGLAYDARPAGADAWRQRLETSGFAAKTPDAAALEQGRLSLPPGSFAEWRGSMTVIDPDGLPVELTLADDGDVEVEKPTRLHDLTLSLTRDWRPTADFVRRYFDVPEPKTTRDGSAGRFAFSGDADGELVVEQIDAFSEPGWGRGTPGAGTVHHVAFRAADEQAQADLRQRLVADGVNVSPVMDRTYFKSIYFREPGGILFEVATNGPGFAVDEPADSLGRKLILPPHLEPHRERIERAVPRFSAPA